MLIVSEFAFAVIAIVAAGVQDIPGVFYGAPPGMRFPFNASCNGLDSASPCQVAVTELSAGRYRFATGSPAATLTIAIDDQDVREKARHLLISVAQPIAVHVRAQSHHDPIVADPVDVLNVFRRTAIPLPHGASGISLATDPGTGSTPIVVAEFGLFENNQGLLSDVRPLFNEIPPQRYHATLIPRALARICLFTIVAAFFVPPAWLKKLNPFLLAAVAFSLCLVDLAILYSPYTGRDLRSYYAGGPLQDMAGNNLNGPIWEAKRLLQGQGFTFADGVVSWAKMPGYGLFSAVAGLTFGHQTLLDVVMSTLWLQVFFYSAALGFFAWAGGRLWRPPVVWAVGLLIAMLPKQLGYTQVDSVIAPVVLLILAAFCIRFEAEQNDRPIALGVDVFVHLTFALWFLMRPDVLPGWAIVSMILHARTPRRLLIPAALAVLIGVGWAAYKAPYTGEFVPTTSTTGASLLCGLWEVPSRFPWVCSDDSYFAWVTTHTPFDARSQAGSNAVVREVLKFWITYPGHFVVMVVHKMVRFFNGDLWSGTSTDLQQSSFQIVGRGPLILFFLTVILLAVVVGYQRTRTFLLAWVLFLDVPLFWIMQTSEGRYYAGAAVALLAGAVPLLFDRDFYDALFARYRTTLVVIVGVAALAIAAFPVHDWLLRNDAFHYWTPFLDPSRSTWGVVK